MKRRERQRETSAAEKGKVELRRDDLLWKDLLARFFVPMLHSLLPDLACDIDEKRDVVFLDKELRRLARFTRQYEGGDPDENRCNCKLCVPKFKLCANVFLLLRLVEAEAIGLRFDVSDQRSTRRLRLRGAGCLLRGTLSTPCDCSGSSH
mgnify:CR=1 FL=1